MTMEDVPIDDTPGYSDLTDTEKWVVLAYRKLKDDYKMIDHQAREGMLNTEGATRHALMASTTFITNIQQYVVKEMKEGTP